jgi:hypothetical protein
LFLVPFVFAYTHKIQKNSVASFTIGHERGSSLPTKISDVIAISPNFKQFYGESLKDAWIQINKINGKIPNSCEKEKLHLYFYYGLA